MRLDPAVSFSFSTWWTTLNPVIQGALVALVGVIATLLVNAITTALQLSHAKSENELDRKLKLKKDVYLSFASEQAIRINAFAKLSDPRVALEEITPLFQRGLEGGARLHVIASPATIAQLTKHGEIVGIEFFRLLPDAAQLRQIQSNTNLANQAIQSALQEQAQILELMKQQNLSGHPDPNKFTILQKWNQKARERYESACSNRDINTSRTLELQTQFVAECNKSIFVVDQSLKKLLLKLRTEINSSDAEEEYLKAASVDYKKIEMTASEALEKVKRKLKEPQEDR